MSECFINGCDRTAIGDYGCKQHLRESALVQAENEWLAWATDANGHLSFIAGYLAAKGYDPDLCLGFTTPAQENE